jgi:hypothetical protein
LLISAFYPWKNLKKSQKPWSGYLQGSSPNENSFCSLKLNMIEERCQDQSCLFWQEDYRNKVHNPDNLFHVQVLVKMVSLALKPSTTEEQCQDISHLFQQREYKNKGNNSKNLSWVRILVKMASVAWKLSMIKEQS